MPLPKDKFEALLTRLNQKNIQEIIDFSYFKLSESQIIDILAILEKKNHAHTLLLAGNEITDKVITHLNKLKTLTQLDISNPLGKGISHTGAATLGASKTIQELSLVGHDSLGGKNSECTARYFSLNKTLVKLKLSHFDEVCERKLQLHIDKNKTGKSIAFLMGSHPRLGIESSINSFFNSKIFDINIVDGIFNLLHNKEPKKKSPTQAVEEPKSKKQL